MSRLLGVVNPNVDPAQQPHDYWIWQAAEVIPAAAEWDFERLNVYTTPSVDPDNVLLWVLGPPTEKYRDGVFCRLHVNKAFNPTPRTTAGNPPPEVMESYEAARPSLAPITDASK